MKIDEFIFYVCGLIAILTTFRAITHNNPVHALLYLIVSFLSISGIFFSIGAYFIGALEIILYTGAIIVLFVFVVMILNCGENTEKQERKWLKPFFLITSSIISSFLLSLLIYVIVTTNIKNINSNVFYSKIDIKSVSISLFSSYILAIELISMLLLAGLVVVFHLGRNIQHSRVILNNHSMDNNDKKAKE